MGPLGTFKQECATPVAPGCRSSGASICLEVDDLNPQMSIRLATEGDLDAILEIDRLSFEKPWDYTKFAAALSGVFLVFEEEEEILGFLSACCSAGGDNAIIEKIAVHPDHRGRRIATRLIAAVLERLREMRIREVELHVDIVKRGAIQLYEKFGFAIRKVLTVDYEENEAFYEMTLALDKK